MRLAYDLTTLSKDLEKKGPYKNIKGSIEAYIGAISVQLDLESARRSIVRLQEIDQSSADDRVVLGSALMVHAIVSYCRAVISKAEGRRGVEVYQRFDSALQKKHREIRDLRNETTAHFGVATGPYGEDWTDERAILNTDNGHAYIGNVHRRHNYKSRLIFDILELCEAASTIVADVVQNRADELLRLIAERSNTDDAFRRLVESFRFDPLEFFGSQEMASSFLVNDDRHREEISRPRLTGDGFEIEIGPDQFTPLSRA